MGSLESLTSVRPEMVGFDLGRGRGVFAIPPKAGDYVEDCEKARIGPNYDFGNSLSSFDTNLPLRKK